MFNDLFTKSFFFPCDVLVSLGKSYLVFKCNLSIKNIPSEQQHNREVTWIVIHSIWNIILMKCTLDEAELMKSEHRH
jgi:hypothetical protein